MPVLNPRPHCFGEAGWRYRQTDTGAGFYRRSEAFDEKEKITIRFADIVTRGATAVDPAVLEYVGKYYSEDEIVELTMVIGLANLVNRINDTLQIEPDLG